MGSTGFVKIFRALIAVTKNAKKAVSDKKISVDSHSPGGMTPS